jgi:S-DNA-T family DNA segregation ATPase FtsK/SpoIIIE
MIEPFDLSALMMVPAVVLAAAAVGALVWFGVHAVRYLVAGEQARPVLRAAWRIKYTWRRTGRRVGLVQVERHRPPIWSATPHTTVITRELLPAITVHPERWGVRVDASTVGRLGVKEFTDAAGHLADVWRVPLVRVEQTRPGRVRLRALLSDPLTEPSEWTDTSGDPAVWAAGIDADGQPVTIRSAGVSGVVVAGLAGYGKTSFLNARFCQLAASPAVQFVLIDGKGGPDYDDLFTRAWLSAKDDPQLVRDQLVRVRDLLVARQRSIRAVLGVKNMWEEGAAQGGEGDRARVAYGGEGDRACAGDSGEDERQVLEGSCGGDHGVRGVDVGVRRLRGGADGGFGGHVVGAGCGGLRCRRGCGVESGGAGLQVRPWW